MTYLAVQNFKEGDKSGGWKYYRIGSDYDGRDPKRVKELVDAGIIVNKADSMEAQAMALELEAKKKLAEVETMRTKAEVLKKAKDHHGKSNQKGE